MSGEGFDQHNVPSLIKGVSSPSLPPRPSNNSGNNANNNNNNNRAMVAPTANGPQFSIFPVMSGGRSLVAVA
jgi:hypothetical protein